MWSREVHQRIWLSGMTIAVCLIIATRAADSDPVFDFCLPSNNSIHNGYLCKPYVEVSSADFCSTLLRNTSNRASNTTGKSNHFDFTLADVNTFPALNTMGISISRVYLGPGGVTRTHTHPRAVELNYVEKGVVEMGFVDTNNKLFVQKLQKSDLFIVPKGLLHYMWNVGEEDAIVLSILNSQNPSFQIPSFALFGPKLPYEVLHASFSLNKSTVDALHQIYEKFV